jgi:hypothetical protein
MSPEQQQAYIKDLSDLILQRASSFLAVHPEETKDWDGHELRLLLADGHNASANVSDLRRNPRSKRARDFRNTMIVT